MAQIIITIPDTKVQSVLDAFGYEDKIKLNNETITNPQTPKEFIKEKVINYLGFTTNKYLRDKAAAELVIENINIT